MITKPRANQNIRCMIVTAYLAAAIGLLALATASPVQAATPDLSGADGSVSSGNITVATWNGSALPPLPENLTLESYGAWLDRVIGIYSNYSEGIDAENPSGVTVTIDGTDPASGAAVTELETTPGRLDPSLTTFSILAAMEIIGLMSGAVCYLYFRTVSK